MRLYCIDFQSFALNNPIQIPIQFTEKYMFSGQNISALRNAYFYIP